MSIKKIASLALIGLMTLTFSINAKASDMNHTFETAEALTVNQKVVGNIAGVSEADYYKFLYPDTGVLNFNFISVDKNIPVDVDIFDEKGNILESFVDVNNDVTSKDLSYCKNTVIYVVVHHDNDLSGDYIIETNFSNINDFRLMNYETEFNDSIYAAHEMQMNTIYNGMLYNTSDADYYVVKPTSLGQLGFEINVYGNTNTQVTTSIYSKEALVADAVTTSAVTNSQKISVTNGDAVYIKISADNADGVYYSIRPVFSKITVKSPTIKSIKRNSKNKMTIKMKSKSGYTGFQIKYSTSKKFTKKTTKTVNVTKLSKTIKLSKKKKTYYVKVRAYKTVRGEKVYSNYTVVKKLKPVK